MALDKPDLEVTADWVHIQYEERARVSEAYGFAGSQGVVNLEGILLRPKDHPSDTLAIYMHPSSTLHLLPAPRAMAHAGAHVLCAASRYVKNDSTLILEKVLLDLGAYIRHAKTVWRYKKVVLVGWSGGGSLAMMYQAQAENPTITKTPAGDPVDIPGAALIPADAVIFQSAHLSRAHLLADIIDPSVVDEARPDVRDVEFDIYNPRNPHRPPYSADFVRIYRDRQVARVRRITSWVRETLDVIEKQDTKELERAFVVHRTMADLRFLDPTQDPNDRRARWSYMGDPEAANSGPVGLARFCTLRSWLSQWSLDDSRGDAVANVAHVSVPLLVIENSADDGVPQPHAGMVFRAATAADKTMHVMKGATHYYAGQPHLVAEVAKYVRGWMAERSLPTA